MAGIPGCMACAKLQFDLRLRFKVGAVAPVYRFEDASSLYVLAGLEWFLDAMGQISELFSNRTRIEAGVGYQMNTYWKFEFKYVWQRSRTGDSYQFITSDNLVQLKVRHYLFSEKYRSSLINN